MKTLSKIYTVILFVFLFAPIAVLIFFSFNEAKSLSVFSNFSLFWYKELFKDSETLISVKNTLILASLSSVIASILGTAAAVGINRLRKRIIRSFYDVTTNIPMINPDIITGISLMLMFVFVGRLFGTATSLNFITLLVSHITFCLPYVILQVLPKLQQMDSSLPEAAMDLGCPPLKAFFKVEIPEILPGIITGLIMSFTLSLDDFVISYFTSGNGFQTLPIRIYNMTKKTVTPKMYALATIIFFTILALLILTNLVGDSKPSAPKKNSNSERKRKIFIISISSLLVGLCALMIIKADSSTLVLNVYNWGEYISDGSNDSFNTIEGFEEWYYDTYGEKVKVNYSTFASNEDMYAKISSGSVSFDVIIPSDYMISRMREENLLLPINFDNIPNYSFIEDKFRNLYYDPDNTYSVPYTYGVVGIIYNANIVSVEDTGSWDLLWNEKYTGNILQFNNSRDGFATAMYKLGIDINTSDKSQWDIALAELQEQAPLVKSYVMDEIYNMMESGEAAIASYYAGDYFTMVDSEAENVDLKFYYPERTNYFFDAMCIPSCCQNEELAEIFINYMLSEEPAVANAEYIYYASPNSVVYNNEEYINTMGEEAMAILYPELDDFQSLYNQYAYRNLDSEMLDYVNSLWETLKIG